MSGVGAAEVDHDAVRRCRAEARRRASDAGFDDLIDEVTLVTSELATNALLHGGGVTSLEVAPVPGGLRVSVGDRSRRRPVRAIAGEGAMTGRGITLVASLAARWGVDDAPDGKVVWAELAHVDAPVAVDDDAAGPGGAAWWEDLVLDEELEPHFDVELGDVPTDLLIAAKTHVENLVRELALLPGEASGGEGPASHLADLLRSVVNRFAEARLSIKHQAIAAARAGQPTTHLVLRLPAGAAGAAEEYLAALDEVDRYSRARRLLTLETPASHRAFRRWYVDGIVQRLRDAGEGRQAAVGETFEQRLVAELDGMAQAQRASEHAVRLFDVARALAAASTAEEVVDAVLGEGVAGLAASAGGVLLGTTSGAFRVGGAVGYHGDVLGRLQGEPVDAPLPAAHAYRTGEAVWLESAQERDRRFPELAVLEPGTLSLCAVPLTIGDRRLGALRLSFTERRLFDRDTRSFTEALATLAAQALVRTNLFSQP